MKTNAWIRIFIYGAAALILLSILAVGILITKYQFHTNKNTNNASNSAHVIVDDGEEKCTWGADAVSKIVIDWVSGSIDIQTGNANEITVTVSTTDESCRTDFEMSGSTLNIRFSEKGYSFGIHQNVRKSLSIVVPESWNGRALEVNCASSDLHVSGLSLQEVVLDSASGTGTFDNCSFDKVDINTASGDFHYTGTLNELDVDAVSADLYIEVSNHPSRIDMDTASGEVTLVLPEDCGYTAELEALSGKLHSEFESTTVNGKQVHGDGHCIIEVDGISGNVYIKKADGAHHSELPASSEHHVEDHTVEGHHGENHK